jgi:arsenate reductase (thioredoxin)
MGMTNMFVVSRRRLVLGLVIVAATGASARSVPRVLFICQFGTAKSAIAREFFRRRARERGISVSTFSRGLMLEDHISPPLQTALRAEGIDSAHDRAQILAKSDLRAADIVVFFNPLPPSMGAVAARDWTTLPSVNDNWPQARADLVQRIDALLDEIAKGRK